MDLIVHAGQHKTGTTSIQQFLVMRRKYFLSHGIYIPTTGQDPNFGHHRALVLDLRSADHGALFDEFKYEISRAPFKKLLVSTETVKNLIVENRYHALVENFRSLGIKNLKFVVYIRNPFHLINASYCEQTKSLAVNGSKIDEYVDRYDNKKYLGHYKFFDYSRFIDLSKASGVEIIFRPYNKFAIKSVVADFLSVIGLPPDQDVLEPRENPSPGPIAIEALRRIGQEVGQIEPAKKMTLIRRLNALLNEFPEPLSYWGISEEIAGSASLAKAVKQTELLSQFAWGRPWRETIGGDLRPVNVFDAETASSEGIRLYETMLARMRKIRASEGL